MPLQIRRGTNAERVAMTVPLAAGELLWITDDQRLYVGNGTTLPSSLVSVTGYTNEDAQDAAASLFTSGTHRNVSFAYNDALNRIDATIDLSNYNGSIDGDLVGSVFADNSTRLIDGTSGKFNLNGTINGHVVPDQNSVYDLGSNANKFRDLYLSGSTIFLGDASITSTGSAVNLPAGSTVNGVLIGSGTGSGDGVIEGSTYKINIAASDSSLMLNTDLESVTASGGFFGNITGNVTGDITGSVFDNNDLVLVDATTGTFYGTLDTGNTTLNSNSLVSTGLFSMGSVSELLDLRLNLSNNLQLHQIIDPSGGSGYITSVQSRGTVASPAAAQPGDELGGILIKAYTSSSVSAIAGIIGVLVDPTATIAGGNFIKSQLILSAASDTAQDPANAFTLNSAGVATSNAFVASKYMQLPVYADDAARSAAIPTPAAGMMVFMTSGTAPAVTNKSVVYDGSAWTTV
jgi:hypothetical protein